MDLHLYLGMSAMSFLFVRLTASKLQHINQAPDYSLADEHETSTPA